MRIRGVVFGWRSSGDQVCQITEIAPFRRSITSPVQEVRDARLVANVQWFKRCRSQPFNGQRKTGISRFENSERRNNAATKKSARNTGMVENWSVEREVKL